MNVLHEDQSVRYFREAEMTCVYCGTPTESGCCGEIHHEISYLEVTEHGMDLFGPSYLEDDLPVDAVIV